jgi:hypothetical protein
MLTMRADVSVHAEAQGILPKVFRSLENPKQRGFRSAFLNRFRPRSLITPGGIHLGVKPAYDVDLDRLERVAARITKGLFFVELGRRLPCEIEIHVFFLNLVRELDSQLQRVISVIIATPRRNVGGRTFCYSWKNTVDDPNVSWWLLGFYERVWFLCITAKKSRQNELSR